MLVITRREGEEVVIGDPRNPIGVVRIASIKGERVRVAFDFPRNVEIHRREIAEQIVQQGHAVAGMIGPEGAITHGPDGLRNTAPGVGGGSAPSAASIGIVAVNGAATVNGAGPADAAAGC
ncbi:MAG: carbon storage regulator [Planctomycetota bacterium]|nr:carbon storage regulator [Planctomycetota bacterium]